MCDEIEFDGLEVIGATSAIMDLPRRLSPVYRRGGVDGLYYFTVSEDERARPTVSLESRERFDGMVEDGEAVRFDIPIRARQGYCLLQLEAGAPPEYVPTDDLPVRLSRACREALEQAARVLSEGRRGDAEVLAWYARRANRDDPLPLLVLCALLRHDLDADEMRFLESDLEAYAQAAVDGARRRAHDHAEIAALGDLLDEPPGSGPRLAYLAGYRDDPKFLSKARGFVPAARLRRRAA